MREFVGQDTQGKNRVFVEASCSVCSKTFVRQKRFVKEQVCSRACANVASGKVPCVTCLVCGTTVRKPRSKTASSGLVFCSRKCKESEQRVGGKLELPHYGNYTFTYRALALSNLPNYCDVCKFSNPLALEVHHKDRNRANNELNNLQILCANCHTIEHKLNG